MASKKKCKFCGEYVAKESGVQTPKGFFCSYEHAIEFAKDEAQKARERQIKRDKAKANKVQAEERKRLRERKKEVKPIKYWQDALQSLVNQYVMKVRDKGMPCATCGNPEANECGHWHSRGARPDIRYNLFNLAPQCHVCNVYKSGAKAEYNEYIKERWGVDVFNELNKEQKPLKEQFPHWSDYEKEIKRYRKLLRDNNVKPCR